MWRISMRRMCKPGLCRREAGQAVSGKRLNRAKALSVGTMLACTLMVSACTSGGSDTPTDNSPSSSQGTEAESSVTAPTSEGVSVEKEEVSVLTKPEGLSDKAVFYSAEDAAVTGNCSISSDSKGFFVTGLQDNGDTCTFTVEITADYFYDLNVRARSSGGEKINDILVDGESIGSFTTPDSSAIQDGIVQRVYLSTGTHEITIAKSWGWINIYGVYVTPSAELDVAMYDVPATLINPNATDNTKRLMSYLTDIYGRYTLSGQQSDKLIEIGAIRNATGKQPAIIGLDLIELSPSRVEFGSTSSVLKTAETYDAAGGIITMAWHWNAPTKYLKNTSQEPWYRGFYTTATTIDLEKIMNGEDQEGYDLLVSDIDAIAEHLKVLQEKDIPLLWRPLHEASGGWFWWGASGPEPYKELWKLMYDRLTNHHGINNLIWLWNGQDAEWYPGDEYVDIIGEDIYPGYQVSTSQASKYFEANAYTTAKKMVVLSENGCIPDPDLLLRDGAMWGYFCTWGGEFVIGANNMPKYVETYTTLEILKKAYEHEKIITLDELPDLKNYKIYE